MARGEMTDMGEGDGLFHTTRWTEIYGGRADDEAQRQACLDAIARRYWRPVFVFLRQKGLRNDEAKDATQGFFTKVVLGRGLLEKADPGIGKFRSYLRRAVKNYWIDRLRAERGKKPVPIDDVPDVPSRRNVSPERAFDYAWASDLLDHVIQRVREDCLRRDQQQHWRVFEAKVLGPIMDSTRPAGLEELARRFGIDSAKQASDMIVTVKRKFHAALRKEISGTVQTQDLVEQELADLMELLSAGGPESG